MSKNKKAIAMIQTPEQAKRIAKHNYDRFHDPAFIADPYDKVERDYNSDVRLKENE